MTKVCLKYRSIKGYRYQVAEYFSMDVSEFFPRERICIPAYAFLENGTLRVSQGYAWDGPSGPVIHTKNWLKPSLIHDVIYQMIKQRSFPEPEKARMLADDLMLKLLRHQGMSRFRAWYSWKAVRLFGRSAASPKNRQAILKVCSAKF